MGVRALRRLGQVDDVEDIAQQALDIAELDSFGKGRVDPLVCIDVGSSANSE